MSADASENGLPEDELEMLTRVADRLSVMGHPARLMIIGILKSCEEAAMMSQFPNMLIFDRADYFAHGDVATAVSIGMAKQGAFHAGHGHSRHVA